MGQRYHSVDVVLLEQFRAVEVCGHRARHRGRAVHRGQNADVVARADAPVRAAIAHEAVTLLRRQHGAALDGRRQFVTGMAVRHGHVVSVYVCAGGDVLGGDADDLAVFENLLAFGDGPPSDLVAAGDFFQGV
ncbi:hypothetical protein D9M68_822490 [compost metagenome]